MARGYMGKRDFISLADYSSQDIAAILDIARQLKKNPARKSNLLKNKSVALIFQKPSNRTRVSFETGIFQLGGNAIYLAPDDISLGKREPTADIAKTLSRYVGGIVARVFNHQDLLELSMHATVPVINALSDLSHPCQALADMMTVEERFGKLKGLKMAYIGDGNNMANSLMVACAKTGMHITVATPKRYMPNKNYLKKALACAQETGAQVILTNNPLQAARHADVLYTDTWVSMGQEKETALRLKHFEGYQINARLAGLANKSHIFMHCLPAHRGQEVSADVIDGKHSVVFDEAENRLHVQKAVMVFLYSTT